MGKFALQNWKARRSLRTFFWHAPGSRFTFLSGLHRIETPRLRLRPIVIEDAPFVFELVNDPDWLRFIGDRQVRTLEDARRYIVSGPVAMYEDLGFGMDLVALKSSGRPIGVCGLLKRQGLEDVDLGFALLPEFRGLGYAFEAAQATLGRGFDELGFSRIAAIASAKNRPSTLLLDRLGFEFDRAVTFKDKSEVLELFLLAEKAWSQRRTSR